MASEREGALWAEAAALTKGGTSAAEQVAQAFAVAMTAHEEKVQLHQELQQFRLDK